MNAEPDPNLTTSRHERSLVPSEYENGLLSLRLLHPTKPNAGSVGAPVRLRSDLHPKKPKAGFLGTPGLRQRGVFLFPAYPALTRHHASRDSVTRWANLCRAYGAAL